MKNIKKFTKLKNKEPIVMLTAYSHSFSKILDKYCDAVLVGDSLANTLYGMSNTHQINLDMMISHAKSVRQGIKKSLMIVDLPINTYKTDKAAIINAKKIIKRSKCDAVKIENNKNNYKVIKSLVKNNIPVMGHIGYTPQFKKKFRVEGYTKKEELKLIKDAKNIEAAGAFSIVLECISGKTSAKITKKLSIPTIGIGSSINCDGQILVTDDIIGLSGFKPRFVKKYINLTKLIEKNIQKYKKDVKKKLFPRKNNSY